MKKIKIPFKYNPKSWFLKGKEKEVAEAKNDLEGIELEKKLADIDEFCGKIKAGKDTQDNSNFSIVARVEALIAGWGIGEAVKRADAYHKAGADAILIHSSKDNANEILQFKKVI